MKICLLICFCVTTASVLGAEGKIISIQKVFADGGHNAFTDLVFWRGDYYLCFRRGTSHISMDGVIKVMKSRDLVDWQVCGTLDTLGDDRDPHFVTNADKLFVFFGTWDLAHGTDAGPPSRGRLRSFAASTVDGVNWSDIRAVHDTDWWLWRVRAHGHLLYSIGYRMKWPPDSKGEARLLYSSDGLSWQPVSVLAAGEKRIPDEADFCFQADGALRVILRTYDAIGDAIILRSDPARITWSAKPSGVVIHSPVVATWRSHVFVAGRGREGDAFVTRLWELKDDLLVPVLTLPSAGDNGYPGLLVAQDGDAIDCSEARLIVSWYSQHERASTSSEEASIYVAKIVIGL